MLHLPFEDSRRVFFPAAQSMLEASGSCDLSMLKGCSSSGTPSFLLPEILQEGASAGVVPFLLESHELSV